MAISKVFINKDRQALTDFLNASGLFGEVTLSNSNINCYDADNNLLAVITIPAVTLYWNETDSFTITLGSQNGVDYAVTYENNVKAGTATVTISAVDQGRYTGSKSKSFTIRKASQNIKIGKHANRLLVGGKTKITVSDVKQSANQYGIEIENAPTAIEIYSVGIKNGLTREEMIEALSKASKNRKNCETEDITDGQMEIF